MFFFFFQAEDGIRDLIVTGVQTCALPILYVALARAAGLPARTAAGLVPVDGRFYYHAWAEVYLGDWVAVDPMLDEFPAGAAHVRFSIGGLAQQAELVRLIGRIKLEVLWSNWGA